jgi:hypothetical protein
VSLFALLRGSSGRFVWLAVLIAAIVFAIEGDPAAPGLIIVVAALSVVQIIELRARR